eukprot:COSAG01_NODE_243_length_20572_cov_24.956137_7_plen_191_part_00
MRCGGAPSPQPPPAERLSQQKTRQPELACTPWLLHGVRCCCGGGGRRPPVTGDAWLAPWLARWRRRAWWLSSSAAAAAQIKHMVSARARGVAWVLFGAAVGSPTGLLVRYNILPEPAVIHAALLHMHFFAAVSCCLAAANHALNWSCNKYAGHCAGFSVRIPVPGLWYLCAMLSTSVLLWLLASCTGDAK